MKNTSFPSFKDCERKAIHRELAVWVKTRASLPSLIAPVWEKTELENLQSTIARTSEDIDISVIEGIHIYLLIQNYMKLNKTMNFRFIFGIVLTPRSTK